ncbi:hypothetical protein BDZ89DRAFT_1062012 [Hymenopellis radicata]|nr:hypothetical protein BDZ89DRAFT_1062012 [Hymenopellis radicata]
MDAQSQSQLLALFEALQHQRLSTVITVFDYLLTLEQEVELIWGSEWTITKLLYLVTRYAPFVNACVLLWRTLSQVIKWMATAGIMLAEVILTVRTWAVWNRHRFLTVCMPALFLASSVAAFTVMGIFLSSLQFLILPLPDLKGCLLSAANPIFRWDFITYMIYEVVMLLLMVVKSYQQCKFSRRHCVRSMTRGVVREARIGVMYYIYLSVLNITNVILISSLAPDLLGLLALLERVVHAMLACRVITNIRAQAKKQVIDGSKRTIGDLGTSVGTVAFVAHDSAGSLE